jgi:hypothetical protein
MYHLVSWGFHFLGETNHYGVYAEGMMSHCGAGPDSETEMKREAILKSIMDGGKFREVG